MIKLMTIVGARPQFIKAAAMSNAINNTDDIDELIIHTGQHYDLNMSEQFFEQLSIPQPITKLSPNISSPSSFIGETISLVGDLIEQHKPDGVVVYGDTNSTLAGAIAANTHNVKLIHIEAGLRSYNRDIPEEHNRVMTDHISDCLFCPSEKAIRNLQKENILNSHNRLVCYSGDIMLDAVNFFTPFAKPPAGLENITNFILATIHRPINTDVKHNLINIVKHLNTLAESTTVIFPIHPRTRKYIEQYGLTFSSNITILEPVSYLEMLYLLTSSKLVVTDSGGLQKEAYFSQTPCIVFRDETEWVELVEAGHSLLAGNGGNSFCAHTFNYPQASSAVINSPYGKGNAAEIMIQAIRNYFKKGCNL